MLSRIATREYSKFNVPEQGTVIYAFNIFFTILRSSALLGKKSSYCETNKLLSIPYVAYSTISSSL